MAKDWERLRAVGKGAEKLFDEGKAYTDLIYVGKWVAEENEEMEIDGYHCSVCDLPMETEEKSNFCPNCGADMREPR